MLVIGFVDFERKKGINTSGYLTFFWMSVFMLNLIELKGKVEPIVKDEVVFLCVLLQKIKV